VNTPFQPNGMNPPPAEKLDVWKADTAIATTVSTGIAIFHQTATLFVSESHLTPITLIAENSSIRPAATR
jgi:hypothetical protein